MNNHLRISSGSISDRGLSEKRPQNEDSYLEIPHCGIYAVADGVGGAQAGEVASQMAVEILGEAFTNLPHGADAESVMRTAIERANAAIFGMAHELPQLATMATTIVALHIAGDEATIGHVGDSRLYRVDRVGNLFRETDDHSMVGEEVRAGRMTEEQAETHPGRNIISRAVGAELNVVVDLKTIIIEPGSAFLICSDGITRHVADQEIKGVLTFGGDPAEICEYLKDLCYERGAEDNLTAVVVKVAAGGGAHIEAAVGSAQPYVEEESTVATARDSVEHWIPDNEDDALLELETRDLQIEHSPETVVKETRSDETTEAPVTQETPYSEETRSFSDNEATSNESMTPGPASQAQPEIFSGIGDSRTTNEVEQRSDALSKLAPVVGVLLLGVLLGIAAYHFAFARADTLATLPLEMKSDNIALTSFEKNRRNVDVDPIAYLKEVPPPEDAEDFYLIGRAHLLTGDKLTAQNNLLEAQKLVQNADPANRKILEMDIWVALFAATNMGTENRLKTGVDHSLAPASDTDVNAVQ